MSDHIGYPPGSPDALRCVVELVRGASSGASEKLLVALIEVMADPSGPNNVIATIPALSQANLSPTTLDGCWSSLRPYVTRSLSEGNLVPAQNVIAIMLALGEGSSINRAIQSLSVKIRERSARIEDALLSSIVLALERKPQIRELNNVLVRFLNTTLHLEPSVDLSAAERRVCGALCLANEEDLGLNPSRIRRAFRANMLASAARAEGEGATEAAEQLLLEAFRYFPADASIRKHVNRLMSKRADHFLDGRCYDRYLDQMDRIVHVNAWAAPQLRKFSRHLIRLGEYERVQGLIEVAIRRRSAGECIDAQTILGEFSVLIAGLREAQRFQDAIALANFCRRGLGDHPVIDYGESLVRLGMADFENGWRLMRSRAQLVPPPPAVEGLSAWDGKERVLGLLVWWPPGAGIGGEVMRLIFLGRLIPYAQRIGVVCDERLHPALSRTFPFLDLLPQIELDKPGNGCYSHCIDLVSLPAVFNGAPEASVPTLTPDPERVVELAALIGGAQRRLRCGFSWFTTNPKSRNRRSLPTGAVGELLRAYSDIEFVSLQHGIAAVERDTLDDFSDLLCFPVVPENDTEGLLALISLMDIVVTTDNSVAHFCGAMNVPTVLMLPAIAEPQWGNTSAFSSLYPSIYILRQEKQGRWDGVITGVKEVLGGMLGAMNLSSI